MKFQKHSIVPVLAAGTSHRIPKRSVLPVGAHLCVRPPRGGVPVRTRADTQVRPYGRPERHIKPQKRLIPPYGWLARFTECQKNVPLCPFWRSACFMKFQKRSIMPVGAHLCVRPPRRAGFRTEQRRRKARPSKAPQLFAAVLTALQGGCQSVSSLMRLVLPDLPFGRPPVMTMLSPFSAMPEFLAAMIAW